MAFFSVNPSENETACLEPDLATFHENCTGYTSDWTTCTVESGVTQGERLRACKPSTQRRSEIRLAVDYVRPCTEKKPSFRRCCHNHTKPCYEIYNPPCPPPPCGCCPQTSTARAESCKKYNPCRPYHKQCPLRIMELAVPTKRHCLDTWRSASHVLPDFMVERIRQYVMDEKPLVAIPEAINCFKRPVRNRCSKSCKPRISDACMSDIRKFSAVFAYCVAQKLDKPLNIVLNPELEKISKIVSYEISAVNGKNKRDKNKRNKHNKRMQDEVSKKVTAWIEDVLVDSKDKLLEDELRELEEKEGPVLDIIDDLIDNIFDSMEPSEPPEDHTSGKFSGNDDGDVKSEKSISNSSMKTDTGLKDVEDDEDNKENDLPLEESNKELDQAELDITTPFTDITKENMNIPLDGFEAVPAGFEAGPAGSEAVPADSEEEADSFEAEPVGLDTENEDFTEPTNVSETFKINSEESVDEKNLTVTFSEIAEVGRRTEPVRRSPHSITFAPPNEHLLSDADELWPEHLPKVSEKPSTIASKSITSLGFLNEIEENKSLTDGDSEKVKEHRKEVQDGEINGNKLEADECIFKKVEIEEVEVEQSNLGDFGTGQQFDIIKSTDKLLADEGKVDYRVDAKTAPSWVQTGRCDYGRGDSHNSVQDRYRDDNDVCERHLRIWATNLEIMCDNLQTWHDWIEITCKNIRHIKRKSERYRSIRTCTCRDKDVDCWMKLKRYINKDAQFWLEFKRNEKRVKTYKFMKKCMAKHNRPATNSDKCICKN